MKNFFDSLRRDIVDFKTLTPQVKFLIVIQVIILFILAILVGVLFSPQFNNQVKQNPNSERTGSTNSTQLSIKPQDEIMKIGEERVISVHMTGTPVTAADMVLTFDPQVLEVSAVTNGDMFAKEIYNKVEDGKMYFSVAQNVDGAGVKPKRTSDLVFNFTIKALKKIETTKIEFSLDETITAEDGKNTLGVAQPAEIHVFD